MGDTSSPRTKADKRKLPLGLIIVFGIFASTTPQPEGLGKLPLQFLLKNDVHVTREQMAAFFFWDGLVSQAVRRHSHRCIPVFRDTSATLSAFSSVLTALSWIGMSFFPHTYGALLCGAIDGEPCSWS